jgi:hypothetical protein
MKVLESVTLLFIQESITLFEKFKLIKKQIKIRVQFKS